MNYLTQPYSVQPPQSAFDIGLIDKTLSKLQNNYDKNKSEVDMTILQFDSQLKSLRDSDNSYIAERLKSVKSTVDTLKKTNGNLAFNYNKDSMLNAVKSVLSDPIIQDALISKQNYTQYQTEVQKMIEKDPKLANDANFKFGLYEGGYYDYMQGKTKKLGAMKYTPYTDLTEEHLDKLKKIKDIKGKRVIEIPDGTGQVIHKEIDGLTNQEIQDYFGNTITSKELKQLTINGWAKYGQDEVKAREVFGEYNTKLASKYQDQVNLLEKKVNNTSLPQSERDQAKVDLDISKGKLESAKTLALNKDKVSIIDISSNLEKANYLGSFANMAGAEWSQTTEKDDVFFAKEDLKIKYENLALAQTKEQRALLEFEYKMKKDYGVGVDGKPIVETSTASTEFELPEDYSEIKSMQEKSTEQFNLVVDTTKDLMSKLSKDQKEHFVEELKKRGVDENLQKVGNGRVIITDAIQQAFDASNLGKYKAYADKINTASTKKDKIATDIVNIQKDSYNQVYNKNPDKYIDNFLDAYSLASSVNTNRAIREFSKAWKATTGSDFKDGAGIEIATGTFGNPDKYRKAIKEALIKNPSKIRDFADAMDNLVDIAKTNRIKNIFIFGNTLSEDAKETVETTLKNRSEKGQLNTMTSYNVVNLLNEASRAEVIKRIPQNLLEEAGNNFDKTKPISVRRVGDKVELFQFLGSTASDKGEGKAKYASVKIDKGEVDLYKQLNTYIDLEEDKNSKLSAKEFTSLPNAKPRVDTSNTYKANSDNANAISESLSNNPTIKGVFNSLGSPIYWSDKQVIKQNLSGKLNTIVGEETSKQFTDKYIQNINNFSITPVSKDNPRTTELGDKVWAVEVRNPEGKVIVDSSLGIEDLDKDTRYLLKYQPQTFITELILQGIIADKNFMNNIFTK